MTGGGRAQADPETGKGETKGAMDKFDVGSLHEVGHGVGGRLGGHAWAESYAWVVAVAGGRVVTARGLAALERFVRDSGGIAARTTTTDELMLLVQHFDAFPPHRNAQGEPDPRNYFHGPHAPAPLRPLLDHQGSGRAALTVNYRNTAPGDSDAMRVFAWTLAIDPVAPMAWTMRVRHWDTLEKRFTDVDHE